MANYLDLLDEDERVVKDDFKIAGFVKGVVTPILIPLVGIGVFLYFYLMTDTFDYALANSQGYVKYLLMAFPFLFVGGSAYGIFARMKDKIVLTNKSVIIVAGGFVPTQKIALEDIDSMDITGVVYYGLVKAVIRNLFEGRYNLTIYKKDGGMAIFPAARGMSKKYAQIVQSAIEEATGKEFM